MLVDFDVQSFWQPSEEAEREYVDEPVTDLLVAEVERQLGHKLSRAYVALMKLQNGGIPKNTRHRAPRQCGPHAEPKFVHVDQEWDYRITVIADNFEDFIRGLESEDAFDAA